MVTVAMPLLSFRSIMRDNSRWGGTVSEKLHRRYHASEGLGAPVGVSMPRLRLTDFSPCFAPKNPELGHAQDMPLCRVCGWWISNGERNAELARGHRWCGRFVGV